MDRSIVHPALKEPILISEQSERAIKQLELARLIAKTKLILFLLGVITAAGSVLVQSSASDLSEHFNRPEIISFFAGCLVALSLGVKFFNVKYLIQVRHQLRMLMAVGLFLAGVLLIFVAVKAQMLVPSLVGTMLIGVAKSLGDVVIQGFIKGFAPDAFIGYTIGTGFAGLFASSLYLCMKHYQFKLQTPFFFMLPLYVSYYLLFDQVVRQKVKYDELTQGHPQSKSATEQHEAKENQRLNRANLPVLLRKTLKYSLTLSAMYFFKHGIMSFLAKRATKNLSAGSELPCAFELAFAAFQLGGFMSRSSLQYFKVQRISLILCAETAAYLVFVLYAIAVRIPLWGLMLSMTVAGSLSGLAYANTIYLILNDQGILKAEKELVLNINSICTDCAVVVNSGAGWLFNTLHPLPKA